MALAEGERKGEPGWELTRRMSSAIGVDFVRAIEYAWEGCLEDVEGAASAGGDLLRYERDKSFAGRMFSF